MAQRPSPGCDNAPVCYLEPFDDSACVKWVRVAKGRQKPRLPLGVHNATRRSRDRLCTHDDGPVTRTRDHHGEHTCLFREGILCSRAKIGDTPLFGSNHDNPVKLLPLADMTGEKMNARHSDKRGVVAHADSRFDRGRAVSVSQEIVAPGEGVDECFTSARILDAFEIRGSTKKLKRVGRLGELSDVDLRKHRFHHLSGICIEDSVVPSVVRKAACDDRLIREAPPRGDARDNADPVPGHHI